MSGKYERETGELVEATEVLWRCAAGVEMLMLAGDAAHNLHRGDTRVLLQSREGC